VQKEIEVEKKILRYWMEVLSRPKWEDLVKQPPLAQSATLNELAEVTLERTELEQSIADDAVIVHVLAVVGGKGKHALFGIAAEVDGDGHLVPPHTDIATLILNPAVFVHDETQFNKATLGLATDVFKTCANVPKTSWQEYLDGFKRSFQTCDVNIETPKVDDGRTQKTQWWIVPRQDSPNPEVFNIVRRYDKLLQLPIDQWPVVFRRMLQQATESQPVTSEEAIIAHVDAAKGQTREVWPLDATQRFATSSALSLGEGQALTVHGPPGTGKTTFLRSLIASMWVKPLLDGDIHGVYPPIIVGAAPTNSSSINMIGAFDGAIPTQVLTERMDCRFLPGHPTYGWSFPASTKIKTSTGPILTYKDKRLVYDHVGERLRQLTEPGTGDKDLIRRQLESDYIATASRVLRRQFTSLSEVINALVLELRRVHELAVTHEQHLQEWLSMRPEAVLEAPPVNSVTTVPLVERMSWWKRILRFLMGSRQKQMVEIKTNEHASYVRIDRSQRFLEQVLSVSLPEWCQALIETPKLEDARQRIVSHATQPSQGWENVGRRLWDEYAEIAYKTAIFHVGARIWEGRWLEEIQSKPGFRSLDEELRIAGMIAPFVVATTHRLPALANNTRMTGESFADLVILDEAGQASVEVAAASISCGKRIVAVGDGKQLEPVRSVEKNEDEALLRSHELEYLNQALSISKGHALVAISGCSIYPKDNGMSGVQLLYHYRCLEPIIQYCNHLSYDGKLVPNRPMPKKPLPWPPISYVLTDTTYRSVAAEADNVNGWRNRDQAREIAQWLAEERDVLERAYGGASLAKIAAVITPYKPQEEVLKRELTKLLGAAVTKDMVIGTVNALQGMERPIVIFSSVVTGSKRSPWLDKNENLLNVAVSRAKDSFVVFGDRNVLFETPAETPLARLGQHIDSYGQLLYPNNLIIVEAPGKREKFQRALGRRHLVVATGGHIRSLPMMNTDIDWSAPPWYVKEDARSILEQLKEYARRIQSIILATDDDREGEAIAWHVLDELVRADISLTAEQIKRMRFSSLAPDALRQSLENAGPGLDMNRVRSALTRDIADYLIGKRYSETLGVPMGRLKSALLLSTAEHIQRNPRYRVAVELTTENANSVTGYVVENRTSVAKSILVTGEEDERYRQLRATLLKDLVITDVEDAGVRRILRQGPDLEAPTTMDMLTFLARHGVTPWDAMSALQELYEGGVVQ
jgi:hypothetical protein